MIALLMFLSAHASDSAEMPEGHDAQQQARAVTAGGVVFKPGKGLKIDSEDGEFGMTTEFRMQLRYTAERDAAEVIPLTTQSYQIRRARWTLSGHFFGKDNTFKMDMNLAPKDVGWSEADGVTKGPLRDGYVQFRQVRDLTLTLGQMKVPFSREFLVSSSKLLLVDRSIAHSEFTLDRDIGLQLSSKDLGGANLLRYSLGMFSGEGPYRYAQGDLGQLYVGRLEVFPLGLFADHAGSDQTRELQPRLSLGAALAYLGQAKHDRGIKGSAPADGGTSDLLNATADLSFKLAGFSLDGAFHWRQGQRNPGDAVDEGGEPIATAPPRDAIGFVGQAGYLVAGSRLEPELRYAHVAGTKRQPVGITEELGGGLAYYVAEHPFKVQGDLIEIWSEGDLAKGALRGRVQLQATF